METFEYSIKENFGEQNLIDGFSEQLRKGYLSLGAFKNNIKGL